MAFDKGVELKEPPPNRRNTIDRMQDPIDNRMNEDPFLSFNPTLFLGGGFGAYFTRGDTFYYPSINVELSLGRLVTLGTFLNLRYSSDASVSTLATNGLLNVNIYPLGKFNQLLVRLGGGASLTRVGSPVNATDVDPTIAGHLGWRYLIKDSYTPVSLGLLLGYQYYMRDTASDGAFHVQFEIGVLE